MKKIILILVVILIGSNLKSQIIVGTFDPVKTSFGIHTQTAKYKFNPVLGYEQGKYNGNVLFKASAGISYPVQENNYINAALCFNHATGNLMDKLSPISIEAGVTLIVDKVVFLIMFDPLNWEGKVGIGFKL